VIEELNPTRREKKKKKEQKKIVYNTSENTIEHFNKSFFQNFNYNYWHHKINALYEYIEKPDKIKAEVMYDHDKDLERTVIENFKLEIHMSVFHSAETLFRVLFGCLYEPNALPVWMARCSSDTIRSYIERLAKGGLEDFITDPDDWLKFILYPAVDEKHPSFEASKLSTKFTKNYLRMLAQEYIDHVEYNSYKHGLTCTAGQVGLQLVDEKTQTTMLSSENDAILFLELGKTKKSNEVHYDIKQSSKTYDNKRDIGLIITTTQILHNIFDYRQSVIKKEIVGTDCRIRFASYQFKTDDPKKLFEFEYKNAMGGFVTKFSMSPP
jgi:hypothetical protein